MGGLVAGSVFFEESLNLWIRSAVVMDTCPSPSQRIGKMSTSLESIGQSTPTRTPFRLPCRHLPGATWWWPVQEDAEQSPVWPSRCDYCETDLVFDAVEYPFHGKAGRETPIPEGYPWRQFGRGVKTTKRKRILEKLRKVVGPEAVGGFQATGPRNPERLVDSPAWMMSDEKLNRFRRRLSIPAMGFEDPDNMRGKLACLYWYHRCHMTVTEICETSGMDRRAVENLISNWTKKGNRFFKKLEAKAEHIQTTLRELEKTVG